MGPSLIIIDSEHLRVRLAMRPRPARTPPQAAAPPPLVQGHLARASDLVIQSAALPVALGQQVCAEVQAPRRGVGSAFTPPPPMLSPFVPYARRQYYSHLRQTLAHAATPRAPSASPASGRLPAPAFTRVALPLAAECRETPSGRGCWLRAATRPAATRAAAAGGRASAPF